MSNWVGRSVGITANDIAIRLNRAQQQQAGYVRRGHASSALCHRAAFVRQRLNDNAWRRIVNRRIAPVAERGKSLEQAKADRGKLFGTHTLGRGVDLQASFGAAFEIATKADQIGFTGIGIKQHGPAESRFIHLDDLGTGEFIGVRPTVWSYA